LGVSNKGQLGVLRKRWDLEKSFEAVKMSKTGRGGEIGRKNSWGGKKRLVVLRKGWGNFVTE